MTLIQTLSISLGAAMLACSVTEAPALRIVVDHRICQALVFEGHPLEHETLLNEQDFRLSEMRGEAISSAGEWPDEVRLSLEIRALPTGKRVAFDYLSGDFRFSYPNLDSGAYCYKLMAPGWKSLVGLVELKSSSASIEGLELLLPLGV